jgi:hypothetical protein
MDQLYSEVSIEFYLKEFYNKPSISSFELLTEQGLLHMDFGKIPLNNKQLVILVIEKLSKKLNPFN